MATHHHVALLRGINVGRANRIAMADLRQILTQLGYGGVRTLLNSGNIVFTVTGQPQRNHAERIERAIADRFGASIRVAVLSGRKLAEAVHGNPLNAVADNPSRLLIMALQHSAAAARLKPLLKERWAPEALAIGAGVAYLWCANGISESRLWVMANRAVGDAGTSRNLTTMTKLLAMVEESPSSG